jgi:hypothetical protein
MSKCKLNTESSGGCPGFIKFQFGRQWTEREVGYVVLRNTDLRAVEVDFSRSSTGEDETEDEDRGDIITMSFGSKTLTVEVDRGEADEFVGQLCKGEVQSVTSDPPGAVLLA